MSKESQVRGPSVLLIAYHFAPAGTVGTHRSVHFARSLHDAGYDVRVITIPADAVPAPDASLMDVFPFPDRVMRVREAPTLSRIYVNLKRRLAANHAGQDNRLDSEAEQPQIIDEAAARTRSGALRTVRRYVGTWDEFPDRFRGWQRRAVRRALELAREREIDAVFASGPPWTGVLVAYEVARTLDCGLILDFRDPWTPKMGRDVGRYGIERFNRLAMRLERQAIAEADMVLFNSPEVMKHTRASYSDLDGVEFRTILNGSDAARRQSESRFPAETPLRIRHFGSLYAGRTLFPLLSAVGQIAVQGTGTTKHIRVEQFGGVVGTELTRLRAGHADDHVAVEIQPRLPFADAVSLMMEPALLLAIQPPRCNPQIPTKLYDYLCTGNPLLVLAPEDSATWSLASRFPRCWRLDYSDSGGNLETLRAILNKWRSGLLKQERTVEDTSEFSKAATGSQFVAHVDAVLERRSARSR